MYNIKTILILISFLFSAQISFSQNDSQSDFTNLDKFVQDNLASVLEKIPIAQIKEFGFSNIEEYAIADPAKALYFLIYEDNRNIKIWRVPITVNGEYRALLNISENNGEFNIADFGANLLAREIQQTINSHQNLNFEGLLRSYQKGSDFMVAVNEKGEKVYIPLNSAIKSFAEKGVELKSIYSENDLKTLLK